MSRRGLLGAAGAGLVGAGAGVGATIAVGRAEDQPPPAGLRYPFHGEHQAGIVTPVQDRLHFAAFDVTTDDRAELITLLRDWTAAAARMTQGGPAGERGPTGGSYQAPPDDTGEAIGLDPAGLTLTFGFGPSLFGDHPDGDRFGLAARRPAGLAPLPHFPGDQLLAERSDGDLCVQACSNDPQVAVHAIRNLARIGFGTVAMRWSQLGFGRTSSTAADQVTARNLFGFKDGTANLRAEQPDLVAEHVWARPDPAARWLVGGSYLVARRIAMTIETWDRQSLAEQELVIGRSKAEGTPLSGGTEFTEPDFAATGGAGMPLIDPTSHVRLAHADVNDGVRLLRRGYNFVDGSTGLGRLDAGLFFIAFVTDPRTHYVPMQNRLARDDRLSEYLRHTGTGLFAVPPGVSGPEDHLGRALFDG